MRLRNPRVEASGNSGPKIRWRAVSPTPAATTRSLYSGWALASKLARRRVPTQTASAPSGGAVVAASLAALHDKPFGPALESGFRFVHAADLKPDVTAGRSQTR